MRTEEDMMEYVEEKADEKGYFICPDDDLLFDLIQGLVDNEGRYGYPSCPCRQASGVKLYDSDIICPCEYMDADVEEYGMCYCGLFVSQKINEDPDELKPIPERRRPEVIEAGMDAEPTEDFHSEEDIPVWRCVVCGYLAARELPPPICPICKAKAERFSRFEINPGR